MLAHSEKAALYAYLDTLPSGNYPSKEQYLELGRKRVEAETAGWQALYSADIAQVIAIKLFRDALDKVYFDGRHKYDCNEIKLVYDALVDVYKENKQTYQNSRTPRVIAARKEQISKMLSETKIARDFWVPVLRKCQELYSKRRISQYLSETPKDGRSRIVAAGEHYVDYFSALSMLAAPNLRLVVSIAKRYLGKGLSAMDLVGEGNSGLFDAGITYNPDFGVSFTTHAIQHIRKAITIALKTKARTVRIPCHLYDLLNLINIAEQKVLVETGRKPSLEQLAEMLDTSENNITAALRLTHHDVHISRDSRDDDDEGLSTDYLEDARETDYAERKLELVETLISSLDHRKKIIVEMRSGLYGEPKTQDECKVVIKRSRERVRQLELQAFKDIQNQIKYGKVDKEELFWLGEEFGGKLLSIDDLTQMTRLLPMRKSISLQDVVDSIKNFNLREFCARQNL